MTQPDPTVLANRRRALHRAAARRLHVPDPPTRGDLDQVARPLARLVTAAPRSLDDDHLAALLVHRWAARWALARTAARLLPAHADRWALAVASSNLLALDAQAALALAALSPAARWRAEALACAMTAGVAPLPTLTPAEVHADV